MRNTKRKRYEQSEQSERIHRRYPEIGSVEQGLQNVKNPTMTASSLFIRKDDQKKNQVPVGRIPNTSEFKQMYNWIDKLMRHYSDSLCPWKTTDPDLLADALRSRPLTLEAEEFFSTCAKRSLTGFLKAHSQPPSVWQTVTMAAFLNSLILGGFEDHCSVQLAKLFRVQRSILFGL